MNGDVTEQRSLLKLYGVVGHRRGVDDGGRRPAIHADRAAEAASPGPTKSQPIELRRLLGTYAHFRKLTCT